MKKKKQPPPRIMARGKEAQPELIFARIERHLRHSRRVNWKVVDPWLQDLFAVMDLKQQKHDRYLELFKGLLFKGSKRKMLKAVLATPDSPDRVILLCILISATQQTCEFKEGLIYKCSLAILNSAYPNPKAWLWPLLACPDAQWDTLKKLHALIPQYPQECLYALQTFMHYQDKRQISTGDHYRFAAKLEKYATTLLPPAAKNS